MRLRLVPLLALAIVVSAVYLLNALGSARTDVAPDDAIADFDPDAPPPPECRRSTSWEPAARSIDEIFDVVRATEGLSSGWSAEWGLVFGSAWFDSDEGADSVRVHMPAEFRRDRFRVRQSLMAAVRRTGLRADPLHFVVGDEQGIRLETVAEFATCPPAILNLERLQQVVPSLGRIPGDVVLALRVSSSGEVLESRVRESSGVIEWDRALAALVEEEILLRPAVAEGIRVDSWFQLPIRND